MFNAHVLRHPENGIRWESFGQETIAETLNKVYFEEGIAVLDIPGWQDVRDFAIHTVKNAEPESMLQNPGYPTLYRFDEAADLPYMTRFLESLGNYASESFEPVHIQLNYYEPGTGLDMHYDFPGGAETALDDITKEESLTFVCVLEGNKDLVIQPFDPDEYPREAEVIKQYPGMVIIMRGATFLEDGIIYPAILHGVPPVEEPSLILTFEVMRSSELRKYSSEL